MTLDVVDEIINSGVRRDFEASGLQLWIGRRLGQLPGRISIADKDAGAALGAFVRLYISVVPALLQCLARDAEPDGLLSAICAQCVRYFTELPEAVTGQSGVSGLLIKAYRCHRLVEEFRDTYPDLGRSEAFHFVNDEANLLVHQLVGEPFANEVDMACENDLDQLINQVSGPSGFDSRAFAQSLAIAAGASRKGSGDDCDCLCKRRHAGGCFRLRENDLVNLLTAHKIALSLGYESGFGSRFGNL
ncbi:hypothetical protein [Allohahella marinimesophila]|uniref:Uncharacterized protein n=1 Tax=Allohahella marinimesophila TaxID=1054972 RepID=A0ABP7PCR1_9GAMM